MTATRRRLAPIAAATAVTEVALAVAAGLPQRIAQGPQDSADGTVPFAAIPAADRPPQSPPRPRDPAPPAIAASSYVDFAMLIETPSGLAGADLAWSLAAYPGPSTPTARR